MKLKAKFEDIVDVTKIGTHEAGADLNRVMMLAGKEKVIRADKDVDRVEVMWIDNQNDFIAPKGGLPVLGAVEDTERMCRFVYDHIYEIYRIRGTLDWHSSQQIFFSSAWAYGKDCLGADGKEYKKGDFVCPNTVITHEGIKAGDFISKMPSATRAQTYVTNVDKSKLNSNSTPDELRIWPYHCQEHTWGAALEGELYKIMKYHEIVRMSKPMFYYKGQDQYSEQYGPIEAEYSPTNQIRKDILNVYEDPMVLAVLIGGQAMSHCVLRYIMQTIKYYANRPDILMKIWILIDCMSPISGFEAATEAKFAEFEKMGIHLIKSTDIKDLHELCVA